MALMPPKSSRNHAIEHSLVNFKALLFLLGLILVACISIWHLPYDGKVPTSRAACGGNHVGPGVQSPHYDRRNEIYDKMEAEFADKGPEFLIGGKTSQSLKISEIFSVDKDRKVKRKLRPARPPVRATVLHVEESMGREIQAIVREHLQHHFPGGVWYQDPTLLHMSLFHASHHLSPVPASAKQVEEEIRSVRIVSKRSCPLVLSLDRVVLTTTGVLLGCWQVLDGTDPAELRDELKEALPRAPQKQMYNRVILHTSLARLLAPPVWPDGTLANSEEAAMPILRSIVSELNHKLCRIQTVVHELWYVEELDVLALALRGNMRIRRFNLTCLQPDWTGTI